MREIVTGEQRLPGLPFRFATSQRDTTIQLGLSSTVAAGAALGMYLWMDQLHVQQPYPLFIALATACGVGLLCTLNLQYSLYLLEITLSHLAHDQLAADLQNSPEDDKKAIARRWPLVPLFARLREAAQRIQHYAANELLTADLRAKALQQASETAAQAERNRIARELHDSIKQQIRA